MSSCRLRSPCLNLGCQQGSVHPYRRDWVHGYRSSSYWRPYVLEALGRFLYRIRPQASTRQCLQTVRIVRVVRIVWIVGTVSGPFILLAFQRTVFQISDKVANHNRQPPWGFHNTVKRALADIPLIERHIKLRAHLATRTPGDVKKLSEFPVSSSLEALGNIRHNWHRGPPNLIPKAKIPWERRILRYPINLPRKVSCLFPDLQVLEVFYRHTIPFYLLTVQSIW